MQQGFQFDSDDDLTLDDVLGNEVTTFIEKGRSRFERRTIVVSLKNTVDVKPVYGAVDLDQVLNHSHS